jgi:hypothetical protein
MPPCHPSRRAVLNCLAAFAAPWSLGAAAQDKYPSKPIKLIVGFAPGGSADLTARLFGERLQAELGQPVVVDNRAGAAGNTGSWCHGDRPQPESSRGPSDGIIAEHSPIGDVACEPSRHFAELAAAQLTRARRGPGTKRPRSGSNFALR